MFKNSSIAESIGNFIRSQSERQNSDRKEDKKTSDTVLHSITLAGLILLKIFLEKKM